MTSRTDRGFQTGGEPAFSESQRIFLLERDLDEIERVHAELRDEIKAIRRMVAQRLNVLVGIGFSLLLSIVAVLVTVIANRGA